MRLWRKVITIVAIALVGVLARSAVATTPTEIKLTASDATQGDQFGHSASVSGDYTIVGAEFDDDGGLSSGSAYVYTGLTFTPLIEVSPAALFMGKMSPGVTRLDSVKVKNVGTADLGVGTISVSGADAALFTFTPSTLLVPPTDSAYVRIVFAPIKDGDFSATLTLNHIAPGSPSKVALTGTGTAPIIEVSPASLSLGLVPPGLSSVDSVKVKNTGTLALGVGTISVSGADAALFAATPSTLTVPAGDSAYVKVTFTPATTGNFSATLKFAHNAGGPTQVALTGSALKVTLSLGTAFGAPENTVSIPVTITNTNTEHPVGGLKFSVLLGDTVQAHFSGLEDTLSNPGFTVSTTAAGDSTRLIISSASGATIPPGTDIPLATLVYVLDPTAVLGSTIGLSTVKIEVADSLGLEIAATALNGEIQIGIRGDMKLDGDVSILDILKLVRVIIGKDASPQIGTTAYNIADANADGSINVADVIFQVNTVLGIAPKPIASGPTAPVIVSLDAVRTLSSGQTVIPVVFDANGLIAGAQFTFTFDPAMLTVGTPQLVGEASGLATDSHVADGMMRAVVYEVTPGAGIKAGQVLYIPVTVRDGSPSLNLTDIILVNPSAQRVEVTLRETTVVVKDTGIPTSFALGDARPNPFNPSTTIAYEVPEQTHITLTIYNLLGQEVVRLVDQVQAVGRYEVVWHGVNARGAGVASGIYLYRIKSGSGYTDAKRMTLLK